MAIETQPFDAARYIDEQGELDILGDAAATGDPTCLRIALDVVARSRGMTEIASRAGMSRSDLFDVVSDEADVDRLVKAIKAIGASFDDTVASAAE